MKNITITDVRCEKGDASFLIDDGKTSILYDVGFGFTGYRVADNVKAVLGERPLDYIFLTHSHYDHALGSAYVLRKYPDAKVVAGEYAAYIFTRDGAKRVMRELDGKVAASSGVTDYEFLGDELKVDITVREGDVIRAGDFSFEVIALPGHTRCCIGFYEKENGLLLSNETLGSFDGEKTIVPSFLTSYADTLASIEKIEGLDVKQLVSPHYGLLSEKAAAYFLKNMKSAAKETADEILAYIKNGKSDEEIIRILKNKFLHGYIKDIYPEDAASLNFSIMIALVKKELLAE